MSVPERRQYRRIQAPVYCRPAGVAFLARHHEAVDISLGGVRVYSDERYKLGSLVKMEFFVKDGPLLTYTAEVVWIDKVPNHDPAKFDVGLKFVDLRPEAVQFLMTILGPEGSESEPPPPPG